MRTYLQRSLYPRIQTWGVTLKSTEITAETLADCDIVVIATNHSCYDAQFIVDKSPLVFDTRNLTKGIEADNLERL